MKPVTQILRAYIEPDKPERKERRQRREREGTFAPSKRETLDMEKIGRLLGPDAWPWFGPMLVFDCETTTGLGQKLRFGVYQDRGHNYCDLARLARKCKAAISRAYMDELRAEGIFYDPENCTAAEIETLKAYADAHGLALLTRDDFLHKVFYRLAYIRGSAKGVPDDTMPRLIIGHNLPFDLGALSVRAGPSRGDNYGGLTLTLCKDRPGVSIRKLGFGKHLYKCAMSVNGRRTLRFLDTQQLGRALLGQGGSGLKAMGEKLGIKDADKGKVDLDGPIDAAMIDYCRADVQRTWRIFGELRRLYVQHGVKTDIDRIYSEASLGKAYLSDFGITPFLQKNPEFPRHAIGAFMEAMFGGRSEVRIRHQIREGMVADFKSEYPTDNTLMRLQRLNIAGRVQAIEADANGEAATFLRNVTLHDLRNKATWPKLCGVALIEADNDVLPVRTIYQPDAEGGEYVGAQQVGVNIVLSGPPTWRTFPDVIASKLLTGKCPRILKTIELEPIGIQSDLKTLNFFGDPDYPIDLASQDFFQRVIEMRSTIKRQMKLPDFKDRLLIFSAMEKGLKLLANSTSYGVLVEFIVDEHKTETPTTVYYGTNQTRKVARQRVNAEDGGEAISGFKAERPGKWFAPWGALIPAAGRLLLAIAERLIRDRGLTYGFCDTDSMFIVRPFDMPRETFHALAREIAGPQGWFQALNPYEGGEPLFNLEDANFAADGSIEPLFFLGVSAKRYALANNRDGQWIIRKASGHGLGHIGAPGYDEGALPAHPAGEPHELCNGLNPKLFCDMWRIAFEAVSSNPDEPDDAIMSRLIERLEPIAGLDQPQWTQHAISSRAEWLIYAGGSALARRALAASPKGPWEPSKPFANETTGGIPGARPFMFFAVLPPPKLSDFVNPTPDVSASTYPSKAEIAELEKRQSDLLNTSLYAPIRPPSRIEVSDIRRRDNHAFPADIFDRAHGLQLATVADAIRLYFAHDEYKSKGKVGELERRRLVILDNEYTGKESTPLIEDYEDESGQARPDDAGALPLFRAECNGALAKQLIEPDKGEALMSAIGVSPSSIHRLKNGLRLNDDAMRRLKDCVAIDEENGSARVDPNASEAEQAARLHARTIRQRLYVIHDAIAKGKDFDLSAATRRSAWENAPRGPVPLHDVQKAIERHLDVSDKAARKALENGLGDAWFGEPDVFRSFPQIEEAIDLASGAARKRAKREYVRTKVASHRARRKTEVERGFVDHPPFGPIFPLREPAEPGSFPLSPDALWSLIQAFVLWLLIVIFPNEAEGAMRKAVRRAKPETVWNAFGEAFGEFFAAKAKRQNADALRKRRARAGKDRLDNEGGRIAENVRSRSAFGEQDAQQGVM
jgi:hypothetical protein